MAICSRRHFLLTTCTLQLITTIERQVFDFLGFMWAPILVNFFNIIFVILGFFGAFQYRPKYILSYCVWNVLWLGWNIFVICFYLNVGMLDKNGDLLNLGTGSFSWWEVNGPGCRAVYDVTEPELFRPARPTSVSDCVLGYETIEILHAATQCALGLMAIVGGVCLSKAFIEEDDSFDFVGGDDFFGHTPLHPIYVTYSALLPHQKHQAQAGSLTGGSARQSYGSDTRDHDRDRSCASSYKNTLTNGYETSGADSYKNSGNSSCKDDGVDSCESSVVGKYKRVAVNSGERDVATGSYKSTVAGARKDNVVNKYGDGRASCPSKNSDASEKTNEAGNADGNGMFSYTVTGNRDVSGSSSREGGGSSGRGGASDRANWNGRSGNGSGGSLNQGKIVPTYSNKGRMRSCDNNHFGRVRVGCRACSNSRSNGRLGGGDGDEEGGADDGGGSEDGGKDGGELHAASFVAVEDEAVDYSKPLDQLERPLSPYYYQYDSLETLSLKVPRRHPRSFERVLQKKVSRNSEDVRQRSFAKFSLENLEEFPLGSFETPLKNIPCTQQPPANNLDRFARGNLERAFERVDEQREFSVEFTAGFSHREGNDTPDCFPSGRGNFTSFMNFTNNRESAIAGKSEKAHKTYTNSKLSPVPARSAKIGKIARHKNNLRVDHIRELRSYHSDPRLTDRIKFREVAKCVPKIEQIQSDKRDCRPLSLYVADF